MTEVTNGLRQTAFGNPALDSQSVFRSVLTALSRPGEPVMLDVAFRSEPPLSSAAGALLLALADLETPVWLDPGADNDAVRRFLRYACGSPIAASPAEAVFAVITDMETAPRLGEFNPGTDEYPDRSTTLIVDVAALHVDRGPRLEGPGIQPPRRFDFEPRPDAFWTKALDNHRLYPRGVDMLFCCGQSVAALPRSTRPSEL